MDSAMDEAKKTGVPFDEALILQESRIVELVSRFAVLKRAGATNDQVRVRLGLSHDETDTVAEWYRDARAATKYEGPIRPN